jgi:hypothetical protein
MQLFSLLFLLLNDMFRPRRAIIRCFVYAKTVTQYKTYKIFTNLYTLKYDVSCFIYFKYTRYSFALINSTYLGNAIAEAVSRWLPTATARARARIWQMEFVVDKVASVQVFSEYFGFPCQNRLFHQLHHHHNHPGQLAEALRRADHPSNEYCWLSYT